VAECAGRSLGRPRLGRDTLKVTLQLDRNQELSPTKNKALGAIDLSEAMVKELTEHLERKGLLGAGPVTLSFSTARRHRPPHYWA
jgi:hypothetical protein